MYLYYEVADPSPLTNQGKQGMEYLFKSGDAVLFEMGFLRDAQNKSNELRKGDVRLLLTQVDDKPVGTLYNYISESKEKSLIVETVIMKLVIDEFRILSEIEVACRKTTSGYIIEAMIPFEEVGFYLESGNEYCGDFGIVYSDKNGLINNLRMNWANKATGLTSDPPSEAKITPAMWGTFQTKNLVKKEESKQQN